MTSTLLFLVLDMFREYVQKLETGIDLSKSISKEHNNEVYFRVYATL